MLPPNCGASAGLPSNQVEPGSRWKVDCADEPTTMVMPTGLKAPKGWASVSVTRIAVLPADEPIVMQSAAVSTALLQAAADCVSLHRLASRSSKLESGAPLKSVPELPAVAAIRRSLSILASEP